MKFIEPKAYLLAATEINEEGMCEYLTAVGAHRPVVDDDGQLTDEIDLWETDAPSGGEELIEVAGRQCYRSFRPGLNPNVSRVREGNEKYIKNIVDVEHGSVVEHAHTSFAFVGVSRVFTHELVRHRVGTAFSQESLRYVRLEELTCWYPLSFGEAVIGELYDALDKQGKINRAFDPPKEMWVKSRVNHIRDIWISHFEASERVQKELTDLLCLDSLGGSFGVKKRITSSMRRLAPIGLGTAIVTTANHWEWRYIIGKRTDPSAEEEIRIVLADVARQLADRFPNLYGDAVFTMAEDGVANHVTFDAGRV